MVLTASHYGRQNSAHLRGAPDRDGGSHGNAAVPLLILMGIAMLEGIADQVNTHELLDFAELAEITGQPTLALAFRLEYTSRVADYIPMQQLAME